MEAELNTWGGCRAGSGRKKGSLNKGEKNWQNSCFLL